MEMVKVSKYFVFDYWGGITGKFYILTDGENRYKGYKNDWVVVKPWYLPNTDVNNPTLIKELRRASEES